MSGEKRTGGPVGRRSTGRGAGGVRALAKSQGLTFRAKRAASHLRSKKLTHEECKVWFIVRVAIIIDSKERKRDLINQLHQLCPLRTTNSLTHKGHGTHRIWDDTQQSSEPPEWSSF